MVTFYTFLFTRKNSRNILASYGNDPWRDSVDDDSSCMIKAVPFYSCLIFLQQLINKNLLRQINIHLFNCDLSDIDLPKGGSSVSLKTILLPNCI